MFIVINQERGKKKKKRGCEERERERGRERNIPKNINEMPRWV